MHEADHSFTVRAEAPVEIVWDEIRSLERLLENVPSVSSVDVAADGDHASFRGGLSRWPRSWRALDGRAHLVSVDALARVEWTAELRSLETRLAGSIVLTPIGTEQTDVTYAARLRCGDRHACRLRCVLTGVLEVHVEGTATRVARRAGRRTAADHALGADRVDRTATNH